MEGIIYAKTHAIKHRFRYANLRHNIAEARRNFQSILEKEQLQIR